MAVAIAIADAERGTRRRKVITYNVTFSGSYASPITLDFTTATAPIGVSNAWPTGAPTSIACLNDVAGYGFDPTPGTTNANSTMKIYSTGGTELTVAAFPAGITAGTLRLAVTYRGV